MICYEITSYCNRKEISRTNSIIKSKVIDINKKFINNLNKCNANDFPDSIKILFLEGENITIDISDCGLSKIDIETTLGCRNLSVSLVKVDGVDVNINGLDITLVEINNSSLVISKCKIERLNFDLMYQFQICDGQKINRKRKYENIDIRSSELSEVMLYRDLGILNIQESKIDTLKFSPYKQPDVVKYLHIWNGCEVKKIWLHNIILKLNVENSEIGIVNFYAKSYVGEYINNKSFVDRVYHCRPVIFKEKNIDAWKMIKNSAINDDDGELLRDAGYEILKEKNKNKNNIATWFLDKSIGYGYKPFNAFGFSALVIIFFSLMYFIVDGIDYLYGAVIIDITPTKLWSEFAERLYLSGITFTTIGYGDITPSNIVSKIISIVEACIGVSILSLFVYAFTKRYDEK